MKRRQFLRYGLSAAAAAGLPRVLRAQTPRAPSNLAIVKTATSPAIEMNGRALLQPSDITYDGAFIIPQISNGDINVSKGLALRRVGGQVRLYIKEHSTNNVFEFPVPGLDKGSTVSTQATLTQWNDITRNASNAPTYWLDDALGTNQGAYTSGRMFLWWDERGQRMYYGMHAGYTGNPQLPCIGFATLNDGTRTGLGNGAWRMPFYDRNGKHVGSRIVKQALNIPQWFADAYLGGRYIGLGCGGFNSVQGVGPTSFGLALVATNPINPSTVAPAKSVNPDVSNPAGFDGVWSDIMLLANKPYGYSQGMHRDTDYNNQHDPALNPSGGYGYCGQSDIFEECNCWVDTGTKHGLLTFGILANGTGSATIASSPAPTATSVKLTSPISTLVVGDLVGVGSADRLVEDAYPNGIITCVVTSISADALTIGLSQVTYKGAVPTAGRQLFRGLWYSQSNHWFTSQKRTLFLHNPSDIASVAQGKLDPYAVQPAWQYDAPTLLPFQPPSLNGGGGWGEQRHVQGCVWDPVEKKIYLLIPGAYPWGDGNPKSVVARLSVA